MIRLSERMRALRQRWRSTRAVSTFVLTAGLIASLTVLWLGLNTYNTLRSARSTIDPFITTALTTGVIGESTSSGTVILPPAYTENPPGPSGSGTFTIDLETVASNMQTYLTTAQPGTSISTTCPIISGLSTGLQGALISACETQGFAWNPPATWIAGYHLDGAIVVGDLQAATTAPYAVSLFGTTYVESQPVVAAELWIPVRFPMFDITPGTLSPIDVPVTTVIQVPIIFAASLS